MNEYVISLGSNINPEFNIDKAKAELQKIVEVVKESTFIYTKPLLFIDQPDFLNGVILISSELDIPSLKDQLMLIEIKFGRMKDFDKNGPRTIDLDIIVSNNKVVDNDVYERDFLQKAIKEVIPGFEI
jgi:2-amino-4-hydroxy-6-hydroxymethyldihydropteridine diphosphokinase